MGPAICRKSEASDSISFSNNAIQSRKHMEYHSLSKSKADRHMEPFIIDVAPTDDNEFVLSSHEGEEFIMVMSVTEKTLTCSRKATASTTIPLSLTTYTLIKDRLPKYWQ